MLKAYAKCEACHRERPTHDLRLVTVVNARGEDQSTLFMACIDTPTCAERVRHQLTNTNRSVEK